MAYTAFALRLYRDNAVYQQTTTVSHGGYKRRVIWFQSRIATKNITKSTLYFPLSIVFPNQNEAIFPTETIQLSTSM